MKTTSVRLRVASLALLSFAFATVAAAQIRFPAASPQASFKQTVGLTDVEVVYSRPSVKDREIFGGLVPYGEVWRTGANEPTRITFSDDVVLGGAEIPGGTYALYTIPGKDEWTVIIYSSTDGWGALGYDPSKDFARFTAKATTLDEPVETFTIGIDHLRNDSAILFIEWDKTRVAVQLEVPTTEQVMSRIDEVKDSPEFRKANILFGAGSFYHDAGHDLPQALEWVEEAVEMSDNSPYWMYARKARLELELKRHEAALASAELTRELASAAKNEDYVRIADDLIASIK